MYEAHANLPSETAVQTRMSIREAEFEQQLKAVTKPFGWRQIVGSGALGVAFVAVVFGAGLALLSFIR
jgi:hypothetical protein